MAILNKRISSATLPQLQKDARLGSIIRDVDSAPATKNEMYRAINPSMSASDTPSPAYVSQLTSALREMQPQGMTSRIAAPTKSNNVSLMSSQMPDMSNAPNISKGPITSITSSGDSERQKIGSTTSTSGGLPAALINALAGAVMGAGASKLINRTTTPPTGGTKDKPPANKAPVTSTVSKLPTWAKGNPTIKDNGNGTYTQTNDDGSTSTMDKDGNIIGTTDSNGDIVDKNGSTVHDNGDGTHTITARDGNVTVINDEGTVIDLKPPAGVDDPVIENPIIEPGNQSIIDPIEPIDLTGLDDFYGKRGGLAVMMKDGGVPHFAPGGPTETTTTDTTTIDPVQSILDLLKTTGGAAGAGGILAALLGSTGGSTNTQNTGLDMSTYGLLKPRTTRFGMGPAKYVSQRDYSPQSTYKRNDELLSNLNAPASNPVNEGDYTPNYVTNRPNTNQNWAGSTDINAIIAQIVNALKDKQLAQNVNQASGTTVSPTGFAGVQTSGTGTAGISTAGPPSNAAITPVTAEQKRAYIEWMLKQPNPAGSGTLADVYKAQGVDPFTSSFVDKQAQSEIERSNRRKELYASSGVSIPNNLSPWEDKDAQKYIGTNKEAYTTAQRVMSDPAYAKQFSAETGLYGEQLQSWLLRSTNPTAWNAQAAAASAAAGLTVGGGAPKAVDPNKPWETASSDPVTQSAQAALAKLNQTPGDDKTRQAALQNFLKTTTFTPEQLSAASNGQWGIVDLINQMAGNPVVEKEIGHDKPMEDQGGTNAPTGGLAALATQASTPMTGVNTDPVKSYYSGIQSTPLTLNLNSIYQNPGTPNAPTDDLYPPKAPTGGISEESYHLPQHMPTYMPPSAPTGLISEEYNNSPTPEELAAQAQAADDAQADQNNYFYNSGGAKRGGAIHKATGGLTHYTFGKPADVMENLGLREQQMARGGLSHVSNVPVVQGRMDFRQGSAVHGEGDGQSDDIPAMLADGEYVIDAETVAQIGNGSTKAGAQALDKFRENIRAHKRSAPINKIPPKTKALTSYLKVK